MIILDTNVVSEIIRPRPDMRVIAWLNAQARDTLFLSSVTAAELWFGIAALSPGKRQQALRQATDDILRAFGERILPFNTQAARRYADLAVAARKVGLGFPVPDGYIAAIAAANDMIVATRDGTACKAAGLAIIDPWTDCPGG